VLHGRLSAFLYFSDRIIEEFGSISMPIDKLLANAAYNIYTGKFDFPVCLH
jgi:hypothetical protein